MNFSKIWERLKYDFKYGLFIEHPYEFALHEYDLKNYEVEIVEAIEGKLYHPKSARYCNVPKGGGLIRPGSYLCISDHFYYLYLISEAYPKIFEAIKWSSSRIDFSYILTGDSDKYKWIENRFLCWEKFQNESLKHLEDGYPYVVITDITGYYENIDHMILFSDLKSIGVNNELAILIKKSLNKWAIVQGKGIPQSCSSSHILGKLYLNQIDLAINNLGITHVRYVDDIRIFCKSKQEAKLVLCKIIELTRERGLNLQSSKTKILSSKDARQSIEGVQSIIKKIKNKITVKEPFPRYTISHSIDIEVEKLPKFNLEPENLKILEETFRAYFLDDSVERFDKTLFHYLLNNLARFDSDFALSYSHSILEHHPEETEHILKYCSKVDIGTSTINTIESFLDSDLSIYPYQNYKIVKWVNDEQSSVPDSLLSIIRSIYNSGVQEWFYKSELKRSLGLFGNTADVCLILNEYSNNNSDLEKAETMFNVIRLERTQRNSFFSITNSDCNLVKIAQDMVKQKL